MARIRLQYIHEYRDRHGKLRCYMRRKGQRRIALPGIPGTPEFMAAYHAALGGETILRPTSPQQASGTLAHLAARYYRTADFNNLQPGSQRLYRNVLDPVVRDHGHRLIRNMPREAAAKIIEAVGAANPAKANTMQSVLGKLFSFACKQDLCDKNPFAGIARYKLGTLHTWSDEQLTRFEQHWLLGTRERLAYALCLYTTQRVSDVAKMRRSDIVNGHIRLVQKKTAQPLMIKIHPALERALKAGPSDGMMLVGRKAGDGRQLTAARLSEMLIEAAAAAGLPAECVPHGLRKASMRLLSENQATTKELAAMSGHKTLVEVERYTKEADQARLSAAAVLKMPDRG